MFGGYKGCADYFGLTLVPCFGKLLLGVISTSTTIATSFSLFAWMSAATSKQTTKWSQDSSDKLTAGVAREHEECLTQSLRQ